MCGVTEVEFFADERERERVEAFCVSGLGHQDVVHEPPDFSVGIFSSSWFCNDCGTELNHYELRGYDYWDNEKSSPEQQEETLW
jgi:hypothetical protein